MKEDGFRSEGAPSEACVLANMFSYNSEGTAEPQRDFERESDVIK